MVTKSSKNFINLILNFDPENVNQKKELESVIFEFPYFQLAHAIYLKSLKIQDQFNFDLVLKKTAILSAKRKLIFNWIENNDNDLFKLVEKSPKNEISDLKHSNSQIEGLNQTGKFKDEPQKMFFVDWVMSYTKIEQEINSGPLKSKIEMIDSFLEKNPKIKNKREKSSEHNFLNLASGNKFNKSELMTETLAKIYVKQKKIKKAIYAYKILILKYPEKSSFFAIQIKKLQKKQNKKT